MTWQTVALSYAVGIVVTAIASILPARRAARIPPMAALRDDVALPESTLRRRVLIGTGLAVLGAVTMAAGLAGSGWPTGTGARTARPLVAGHAAHPAHRLADLLELPA